MKKKREITNKIIPTPAGVDFSKKKDQNQLPSINQCHTIPHFFSPTPPDRYPPFDLIPPFVGVCGFGSVIDGLVMN